MMNISGSFPAREMFEEVLKKYGEEEGELDTFQQKLTAFHDTIRIECSKLDSTEKYPHLNEITAIFEQFQNGLIEFQKTLSRFSLLQKDLQHAISKMERSGNIDVSSLTFLSKEVSKSAEGLILELNKNKAHLKTLHQKVVFINSWALNIEIPNIRDHSLVHLSQHIKRIKNGELRSSQVQNLKDRFCRYMPQGLQ